MISTRRAVLAFTSWVAGPPAVAWLGTHDKPGEAALTTVLLLVYVGVEAVAYYRRDRAAARAHLRFERTTAGPILGDYCAQVEDHYYEQVERHNGRWAS